MISLGGLSKNSWSKGRTLSLSAALCGLVVAVSCPAPTAAQEIEIAYGVDFVSNYISKGITQTDDGPAIQPYLGFSYNGLYLDFWGSNVSFGGISDIELDVSVGYRWDMGDLSLDVGFVQYLYRDDKNDYGEAYLFGEYAFGETAWAEFKYYREVYADQDWFYVGGGYSGLPWDLTVSGGIGSDFGTRNLSEDLVAADLGLTKDLTDNAAIDLRVNDSSIEGTRVIFTLSLFN